MPKLDDLIEFSGEDNVYEVEKIVGVHKQTGKPPLYRVRWKGYGPEEDTYEPRDHLLTCEDMIDDYILAEEKKQKDTSSKNEMKKPVKRRHSGESASPSPPLPPLPPSSPSETKIREVAPKKEVVTNDDIQETPSIASSENTITQEDEDQDDVDRRALLKDPFWNDLQNGMIVPNLFETDMYSKVKSRRATLEAKRKKKEEDTDDQKSSSLNESQSSEKSSPGSAGKKKESPSKDESEETRRHRKKKHSNKHDPGKKKKKKKDHKNKKKHRKVKMDLEAIGSLESATQKSLKMSPSDLDGSDNSANLFISCKPAEEVLTVAKLVEQSRQSSSNGSHSSDSSEEIDRAVKSKDTKSTNNKEDSLRMLEPSRSGQSHGMGFLSPDIEKMLERNPFSLSEPAKTAVSSEDALSSDQSVDPSMSKEDTLSVNKARLSLWDQLALPKTPLSPSNVNTDSSATSVTEANSTSSHTASETVKKKHVNNIFGAFVKIKEEVVDSTDGESTNIAQMEPGSLNLSKSLESGSQQSFVGHKPTIETQTIVKEEPLDPTKEVSSLHKITQAGEREQDALTPPASSVMKQESIEIPDSIEDHLTSVEPGLETVLKSPTLGNMEELPNLTGNLFDNFLPANSPFTDDEQRNSGSEEPRIDVGQLLSSLEDRETPKRNSAAKTKNLSTLPAIEGPKEISEKEPDSTREKEHSEEASYKEPSESEMRIGEATSPTETSSLVWPWSGSGPLTSPVGDTTKEDQGLEKTESHESNLGDCESCEEVQGNLDAVQGSDTDKTESSAGAKCSDGAVKGSDTGWKGSDAGANGSNAGAKVSDAGAKRSDEAAKGPDVAAKESNKDVDVDANRSDAGAKGTDAGAKGTDAGAKGTDAGTKGTDAGAKGTDAGAKGTDAGADGSDKGQKKYDGTRPPLDAQSHITPKDKMAEKSTAMANKNISKTVSKETLNVDTTESANGHDGNNLFDSLKSCLNKEKHKEKSQKPKPKGNTAIKLSNLEQTKKPQFKLGVKLQILQKDKQQHVKASNMQTKRPKKQQALVMEKAREGSKSKTGTKIVRKEEEKNNNNIKILQKGADKLPGNKDQETKKKQLHEKSEEKKKKKIIGGSWKFDSINEIPKNDENKVPMELIDKNETLDEDYLCKAITEGDLHLVHAIMHHCPNLQVDSPNSRGQRPLVLACMGGQNEILKKLILSRASVDMRLNNGVTPLMIAAELGYTSTAGILLEAGAFVNLANTSGETALIKASRKGHVDVVQLLLHYGADWGQTSQENTSALSLAKQHKMYLVSDLLQKHEQSMVEQLEYGISQYMWGTARLVHSVLPSRCFRIRESTQHLIKFNFDPAKIPFSPTLGTMLFLCHVSPGVSGMSCHLTGPCHVKEVTLNGVPTNPVPEGNGFVMEFIPKAGVNTLNITTHPDPYTKMLLLVAAYSLQLMQS